MVQCGYLSIPNILIFVDKCQFGLYEWEISRRVSLEGSGLMSFFSLEISPWKDIVVGHIFLLWDDFILHYHDSKESGRIGFLHCVCGCSIVSPDTKYMKIEEDRYKIGCYRKKGVNYMGSFSYCCWLCLLEAKFCVSWVTKSFRTC